MLHRFPLTFSSSVPAFVEMNPHCSSQVRVGKQDLKAATIADSSGDLAEDTRRAGPEPTRPDGQRGRKLDSRALFNLMRSSAAPQTV